MLVMLVTGFHEQNEGMMPEMMPEMMPDMKPNMMPGIR